jgi:3-oxoadipate enol-lactonase
MPTIKTSDAKDLHYEEEGAKDGPPLLFSNSLGTNLHMWDAQAEAASSRGFRVIRYDQRGHGQSEAPKGDYTMERLGKDILDLLDALGLESTNYCGLSMGGMAGIWVAMHRPRRFSRAVFANTAIHFQDRALWDGRIRTVTEKGMAAVVDAVVERWFTADFREANEAAVDRVKDMILSTKPEGYAGCAAAIRDMDMRDRLGLIEAPVLVVVGAKDPATPPDKGEYIVSHIPGAQLEVLDAAHLSNIEKQAEFNAIVLDFLAGERHDRHI